MADKAMDTYLNDHLAGATLGSDLAEQIETRAAGTPLREVIGPLAVEIEEDRQALIGLMQRIESSRNPIKQTTAWVAERASRVKFAGLTSGEPEVGMFMALESLMLGVQGKLSLWRALEQVADRHPVLASINLSDLIQRAQRQYETLERERLAAGQRALSG
jgi:hypothetical protein